MAERDELLARADELGIEVNRRWGVVRLREALEDAGADTTVDSTPDTSTPGPSDDEAPGTEPAGIPEVADAAALETWPRQIAPVVWVDQDGRRFNDLAAAQAGQQEIRDRTG